MAFITAVVVTIQRAKTATELKKENEDLRASLAVAQENLDSAQNELTNATDQLAYSEEQVNLLEESTSAFVLRQQSTSAVFLWLELFTEIQGNPVHRDVD